MKKLVILMLVLGMTAAANASLSGSISPTDEASTDVTYSVDSVSEVYLAIGITGSGTLSAFTLGAGAPADSIAFGTNATYGLSAFGQGELWAMIDYGSYTSTTETEWLTTSISGQVSGDVITMQWSDNSGSTWTGLDTITVTPEPITIALLGLGGLFIRRKK